MIFPPSTYGDVPGSTWNATYMMHAEVSGGLLKHLKTINANNSVAGVRENVIPLNAAPLALPFAA